MFPSFIPMNELSLFRSPREKIPKLTRILFWFLPDYQTACHSERAEAPGAPMVKLTWHGMRANHVDTRECHAGRHARSGRVRVWRETLGLFLHLPGWRMAFCGDIIRIAESRNFLLAHENPSVHRWLSRSVGVVCASGVLTQWMVFFLWVNWKLSAANWVSIF